MNIEAIISSLILPVLIIGRILLAQAGQEDVTGWIQILLQGGVAVYIIWWFTTRHAEIQREVAKELSKLSHALRENAVSNNNVVLALRMLDSNHPLKQLAQEQKDSLQKPEGERG